MSDPRPGFQRDVNAVVEAFKVGLPYGAISIKEYRESLRAVGMPLFEPDELELPDFNPPNPDDEDDFVDPPEEDE